MRPGRSAASGYFKVSKASIFVGLSLALMALSVWWVRHPGGRALGRAELAGRAGRPRAPLEVDEVCRSARERAVASDARLGDGPLFRRPQPTDEPP
jgi:hypothetical protein